ncbi:conserved hypothetical protein [Theileria orientalis strain Shintoku]|uniref:Uncharacterized protein n=1 Tax=Theileria orientalis strain Shintoku TaxID=869250 RepID=J4C3L9_THEOR|nr:conserved hypothetical protein [Theileria orientalis strain Shintoku]BAM40671.1 conserved hypothetical protein [Theileria orientalis strain Shintoku]|eukprot:XP_009690972.1 conserved hypothetical protein [Theileria orientalis strain Shintoku]
MVRLVPPFLRNIIGSADEPTNLTFQKQLDNEYTSAPSIDASDSIKEEQLESLEVTSNIATIASIDWGPPKLNPNVLDELGNSGRYLFDMLRGNKLTFENPELLKRNIKNVPKVYESDFNVYLEQMTKIESTDLNVSGDALSESDACLSVLDNDKVSREYFEDDYNLNDNAIFNSDLEVIPNSIDFLESQLMVINSQLRELVGTHLKHVGESFVCIEDLKDSYLSVNDQLTNVRSVFDNLKGIYHSPVDYHSFKISRSSSRYGRSRFARDGSTDLAANISEATTNTTTSASASGDPLEPQLNSLHSSSNLERGSVDSNGSLGKRLFEVKYNEAYTLHEVLLLKRKVIDVMENLTVLRGVVCTPEYVQGLVSNDMALARIFAFCAYEYFRTDLAKFTLTNSVNLVLKDTIVNLERVAEAKFVDLCYFTFTKCYAIGATRSARFEAELKGTLEKMEPVLIVLIISGILDEMFDTLKSTKMSPVEFKNAIRVEQLPENLEELVTGLECSNLFVLHLLELVKTVRRQNESGKYLPDSERARKILERLIFKIQESFPDGINRDYQKIDETTQFLKSELDLPTSFKFQEYSHYWHYYRPDSSLYDLSAANSSNGSPLDPGGRGDISKFYEKLSWTVENLFVKSMENLFNNLHLNELSNTDVNDLFNEMETTLATIKGVEDEYRRSVKRASVCLQVTSRLVQSLLSTGTCPYSGKDAKGIHTGASVSSKLMKIFYNFVNAQVRRQVGQLFEQSLVEVHGNLNKEQWEEFEKIKLESRAYNLIRSAVKLSEHLDIYFSISEKFPFLSAATVSKSINLFAYFNTLIENELERNLSVKKLCLILETLDYFTVLIPLKIRFISIHEGSGGLDVGSLEDYDKLLVLGINAENCVMESKLLRNKAAGLLANFVFSQIKMYLINWVFKYTDIQEGDAASQEGTEEVDMVIKTIEDLHAECAQFCTVVDLKATFGDSFEKLVDLLRKQKVELSGCNKFSDDCTRIITNLAHLTDIKLEILSLAHGLSS